MSKFKMLVALSMLGYDFFRVSDEPHAANVHRVRAPWEQYEAALDHRRFIKRFRVSKEIFHKVLEGIGAEIERDAEKAQRAGSDVICKEWRLAITLRLLAGGRPCDIADIAHIHEVMVWKIVHEVCAAINRTFPIRKYDFSDIPRMEEIEKGFAARSGGVYRGCVGALDGCALRIRRPTLADSGENPTVYYNRKGFYAINMQAVCDSAKRFLYLDLSCPCSTHDSTAWGVTSRARALADGELDERFFVAGDEAYKTGESMVTPWPGRNLGVKKDSFNFWRTCCVKFIALRYLLHVCVSFSDSNSRINIECCFGIFHQRWGIFWRPLDCKLSNVKAIVFTCAILHNMLIDNGISEGRIYHEKGDGGGVCPPFVECGASDENGEMQWMEATLTEEQKNLNARELRSCRKRARITEDLHAAGLRRPAHSLWSQQ